MDRFALHEAAAATEPAPVDPSPAGFAALRGPVTQAAIYAYEQGVLPRPVMFALVEQSCTALGVERARLG